MEYCCLSVHLAVVVVCQYKAIDVQHALCYNIMFNVKYLLQNGHPLYIRIYKIPYSRKCMWEEIVAEVSKLGFLWKHFVCNFALNI